MAESPNLQWRLRLLGRGELTTEERPAKFRSAKVLELIAFLATQPDRRAPRSQVADALYGESVRARENLRQTLLYLSQAAPELVEADRNDLRLLELESDVSQFLDGDNEAYSGPFLPDCESDWALAIRADLEELFVARLLEEGNHLLHADPARAAALAKQAIKSDPFLDQARRLRWHALERLGEQTQLAAEQAEYKDFIRREVGIEIGPFRLESLENAERSLTPAERLQKAIGLAPLAFETGRLHATAEDLIEKLEQAPDDHPFASAAWIEVARIQYELGDTASATDSLDRAQRTSLSPDQDLEVSSIRARALARQGEHERSEHEARRADRSVRAEVRAEGKLLRAYLAWASGEYAKGIEFAEQALREGVAAGSDKVRVRALRSKGNSLFRAGDVDGSLRVLTEAIAIAEAIGRNDLEAACRSDVGRILEAQGDLVEAAKIYRTTIGLLENSDFRIPFAQAVTYQGDLELRLGNPQESRRLHAIGLGTRRIIGDLIGLATSYRGLGKAEVAMNDYRSAIDHLRVSLRLFRRFGESGSLASARLPLAMALAAMGERESALKHVQQASTELAGLGDEEILVRYNDESLLPAAIAALTARLS